jgi:hypothetical protein
MTSADLLPAAVLRREPPATVSDNRAEKRTAMAFARDDGKVENLPRAPLPCKLTRYFLPWLSP